MPLKLAVGALTVIAEAAISIRDALITSLAAEAMVIPLESSRTAFPFVSSISTDEVEVSSVMC